MEKIKSFKKMRGVDVGYHSSIIEPLNSMGRKGKAGIDKTFTLEQIFALAYEVKANIIIKAGANAKWYLKKFDIKTIDKEIEKQKWRDTSRYTMWIIQWDE
jgi:hypothetical protein